MPETSTTANTETLSSEDAPFRLFLKDAKGLRSFQPTLLWKISFTGNAIKDAVMFTDSITVPGEKISTGSFETFIGDVPYPYMERRSTNNTFNIGMYVDIYGTLETIIGDIIRKNSKFGIKQKAENKETITLTGFRMGDTALTASFTRPAYIKYTFYGCMPIAMDEYTYDHKNSSWARTRNVTFAFNKYDVVTIGDQKPREETDLQIIKTTADGKGNVNYNNNDGITIDTRSYKDQTSMGLNGVKETTIQTTYLNEFVNTDQNSIIYKPIKAVDSVNDDDRTEYTYDGWVFGDIKNSEFYKKANDKVTSEKLSQQSREELRKELTNMAGLNSGWEKTYVYADSQTATDYKRISPTTEGGQSAAYQDTSVFGSKHKLIQHGNKDEDTIKGRFGRGITVTGAGLVKYETEFKRDSLLGNIIKTAVQKFFIPDAPLYNSGHGMAWQPGFMKDVSKAIRKVQQVFYTEPKIQTTPEEDRTLINTHTKASTVGVDPDDTPLLRSHEVDNLVEVPYYDHIVNHGPADTRKIPQDDFTYQNHHGDPNNVAIDPNDYTKQNAHGDPNTVAIDPDDYTKQNAHGDPNHVAIDPNDHTLQNNHGEANHVMVDPDDYTRQNAHGDPNHVAINPNDHTVQNSHGKVDEVFPDENDAPVQTTAKGNQVPIDPNDFVKTATLTYDNKPIDPNDHIIDSANLKANLKPINADDYVVGSNISAKTLLIDPDDYVRSINIKSNHVKISPNDHVTDQSTIKYKNIKIEEQDYATTEDVLNSDGFEYVPTNSNDRTNVFDHPEGKLIPVDYEDKITDHRKPDNMIKVDSNDKILKHRDQGVQVPVDSRDTPDISSLNPKHVAVEQSYIDFARLIVNSVKTGADNIRSHNEDINLKKIDDDKLVTHQKFGVNIVERPKEAQSIVPTHKRDVGTLVDVHEKDHTELN